MNVKIDTKEKFHEITVLEHQLSAAMAAELEPLLTGILDQLVRNVILVIHTVESMENDVAEKLAVVQGGFMEAGASFVICEVQKNLLKKLEAADLLDSLNIVPTLSEAWDMVQMEEMERELLGDWE